MFEQPVVRCRETVHGRDRYSSFNPTQCHRAAVTKDGFCTQHSPEARTAREKDATVRFHKRIEDNQQREIRYGLANASVEQLREELAKRKK